MSRIRNLVLPLFLLMATFSAGSTQAHQPLKTTIYQVEALRWYWISGYSWHSVYETTDHDDAEFVEALLHIALENDQIDEVFNYGDTFSIHDFRITTVIKFHDVRKTRRRQATTPTPLRSR